MISRLLVLSILSVPLFGAAVRPVLLDQAPFGGTPQGPLPASNNDYVKVPVTLGVMSRCPDALFCENVLDTVFYQVGFERIDVSLDFIAKLNESEPDYGVTCMHGQQECAGNVQELCVAKHVGRLATWWPWLDCVNMAGREMIGVVETAIQCAWMTGIDWVESGVRECVLKEEGRRLLKESMERAVLARINKSCTIIVSGKVRCIRDGGGWSDCEGGHTAEDLTRTIVAEWERLNHDKLQNA